MLSLDSNSNQLPISIPLNISSMFEPLKIEAYLNADEEDCVLCDSFLNLINEQMKLNKPYMLALLQDIGSSFTFCFDAIELNKWTENNWTNPQNRNIISQIFYFSISSYSSSTYLGRRNGWNQVMLPSIENKFLISTNKQFVKIDGIDNVMNLKPFLKACIFVDTKESVHHNLFSNTKISFFELLKSQEKNNLPYVFAVVQDVDNLNLSYFDGLEFKKWSHENSINPLTGKEIANAFYCMIPPNLTKNQNVNFKYLGDFKEEGDKQFFIDTLFKALNGNPVAQYFVGGDYKLGKGVAQDFEQAVMWFKLAAESNHLDALYELGICYNYGIGIKKDMKKANALWKQATSGYHADSAYRLGLNYWEGKGVQKDRQIALLYFSVAEELGQQAAKAKINQWELEASDKDKGQTYCLTGLGCLDLNTEEGIDAGLKWLNLAIEKKNADAIFIVARFFFKVYKKAESSKETDAENHYKAKLLELMKLDINPNFEEILKYNKFLLSKKQEQLDAILTQHHFELGIILYEYGDKVRDANKIIKWFKLAANKGHAAAQCNLGVCYYSGECVKKDSKTGLKWLKLAAKEGDVDAKTFLTEIQTRK